MKTTKELKIWSLRMVLFTILLSGLSTPMARTSTLKTHLRTVTYKLPSPVIKQEK